MSFSMNKIRTLKPQKEKALSTFLLALCAAAVVFLPYMWLDNGYFLFFGDFNVQQIPFYMRAHDIVKSGNFGWDFGTDLGVNFIGSYSFYLLGSPFFWLTIPFPSVCVPYLLGPLLILKFGCAAWAAYMFLRRFLKDSSVARLCAILYAFSGFSVYNIFFNHFHEAIIAFPLLLLSFELLLAENRRGFFAFMVGISALVNYFFFYGMVVFVIIYWIVRLSHKCYKFTFSKFLWLLFESVLGLAISAVLFYPTVLALIGNGRISEILLGWTGIMYGKEQIYANILGCFFFPPDLPARPVFFPQADVKWSSLGGWLPLFSMVGVFAYLQQRKKTWLSRLLCILIFMALVPFLNSAFYMFNTAYYARWFYMPILLMCLATGTMIENENTDWKWPFKWVAGITLAVTVVIGFFPSGIKDGKIERFGLYTYSEDNTYMVRFFLSCGIAAVALGVLGVLLSQRRKNYKFFINGATAFALIISVIYASLFVGLGKTHAFDVDDVMIGSLLEAKVDLPDKSEWRIDAYDCVDNTAMYLDFDSINAFHSIVPVSVTDFWKSVGEQRGVASRPSTNTYSARSLLSVKYLLDLKDSKNFADENGTTLMRGYTYCGTQANYDIYENQNYIPYGFTYDYYVTEGTFLAVGQESDSNLMLKAMYLSDEQAEKYRGILTNITDDYVIGGIDPNKTYLNLDYNEFVDDCKDRAESAAYSFEKGKSEFKAKIKLERDNLVFFSIPYDKGWTAYVNGKETEIEKVNVGFMAVLAPKGDNEIRFVYRTPGLKTGIFITAGALLLWIAYTVIANRIIKKNGKDAIYPEGERLIAQWEEYERAQVLLQPIDNEEPSE